MAVPANLIAAGKSFRFSASGLEVIVDYVEADKVEYSAPGSMTTFPMQLPVELFAASVMAIEGRARLISDYT